jgi:hypothetical protein
MLDTLQTSSAPKPDLDLAWSQSPPGTDSDHSHTKVPEATADKIGSAYSNSNRSDIDNSQLEEEEEEDGSSLDPNDPLRGLEGLEDSRSNPYWGEAAPEHLFPS